MSKEDLKPHLELYVKKYGTKNYHGGNIESDILNSNIDSITFYNDSNNDGLISVCHYYSLL